MTFQERTDMQDKINCLEEKLKKLSEQNQIALNLIQKLMDEKGDLERELIQFRQEKALIKTKQSIIDNIDVYKRLADR